MGCTNSKSTVAAEPQLKEAPKENGGQNGGVVKTEDNKTPGLEQPELKKKGLLQLEKSQGDASSVMAEEGSASGSHVDENLEQKLKELEVAEKEGETEHKKEDEAATLVQARYRGHKVRAEMADKKADKDSGDIDISKMSEEEKKELEGAASKIQARFKGHKAREEMKEKKEKGDDKDEDEIDFSKMSEEEKKELDEAAIKIQARFKGKKTRDGLKKKDDDKDDGDIDISKMNEEEKKELEEAASKIQARFKGHKAREEMKEKKEKK